MLDERYPVIYLISSINESIPPDMLIMGRSFHDNLHISDIYKSDQLFLLKK